MLKAEPRLHPACFAEGNAPQISDTHNSHAE